MEQKWRLQKQTKFSLQCQNAGNGFLEFKILLGQFAPPPPPYYKPSYAYKYFKTSGVEKQPVDLKECCEWYR